MSNSESWRSYFDSRLTYDKKRLVLWGALWDFALAEIMKDSASILELGAGWCDFINTAESPRRVAIDLWPGVVDAAAPGVQAHIGSALDLSFLPNASIDAVFASNLVEHLTLDQCDVLVKEVDRVLAPGGKLVLVQPNFRLSYKRYFDDFTHLTMWSEVSLADYLSSRGWHVDRAQARFMPFSIKSRLPVSRFLIRCYLASPIKPMAGQMLVVAHKGTNEE